MGVDTNDSIRGLKRTGERAARNASYNPWTERLMRLGYAARGIVYGLIGILAIQVALGRHGQLADQQGAIVAIGRQPWGHWLLILLAIGLAGYSLWGLVRAVFDPLRKGHDAKGIVQRLGYLVSAVTYALLAFATFGYINSANAPRGSTQSSQQATAAILAMPGGRWIVGLVGLIGLLGGLYQVYQGYEAKFDMQFKSYALSGERLKWAIRAARFGTAARGVVFAMIGAFLIRAALYLNPREARGIDGALQALANQPYGPYLLAIVAAGLIAFGAYSLLGAAWFRFRR